MVKLTAELIEQAAQYTNAVRDRELDLRGESDGGGRSGLPARQAARPSRVRQGRSVAGGLRPGLRAGLGPAVVGEKPSLGPSAAPLTPAPPRTHGAAAMLR